MEIELIEQAYAAKKRIERNKNTYKKLTDKLIKSEAYSPMEKERQFGQDFCNLTIGGSNDFYLDLSYSGCNSAIIGAIVMILKDKIKEDEQFIASL